MKSWYSTGMTYCRFQHRDHSQTAGKSRVIFSSMSLQLCTSEYSPALCASRFRDITPIPAAGTCVQFCGREQTREKCFTVTHLWDWAPLWSKQGCQVFFKNSKHPFQIEDFSKPSEKAKSYPTFVWKLQAVRPDCGPHWVHHGQEQAMSRTHHLLLAVHGTCTVTAWKESQVLTQCETAFESIIPLWQWFNTHSTNIKLLQKYPTFLCFNWLLSLKLYQRSVKSRPSSLSAGVPQTCPQ